LAVVERLVPPYLLPEEKKGKKEERGRGKKEKKRVAITDDNVHDSVLLSYPKNFLQFLSHSSKKKGKKERGGRREGSGRRSGRAFPRFCRP